MSDNRDFNLDIESILEEFSSYSQQIIKKEEKPPAPVPEVKAPVPEVKAPAPAPRAAAPRPQAAPERRYSDSPRHAEPQGARHAAQPQRPRAAEHGARRPERHSPARRPEAPAPRQPRPAPKAPAPARAPVSRAVLIQQNFIGLVCAAISFLCLGWIFLNIHPDSGTVSSAAAASSLDLVSSFDAYANNAASDALGELAYIPKIYTIPENATVAPKPDGAKYGTTSDPSQVQAVIDSAAALLDGQELAWDPNANFVPGTSIRYYCDDTILVIAWLEDIEGKCVTCAEVKVAHGSQLRRKVAGDTYSTGVRYYASDMAKECNAVVAINGDFYDFRNIGVTVYQRQLYRFAPDKLDSCSFTSSGDMLFSYAGEFTDAESTQQFIYDNDVLFTVSFGPILVDNGELRYIDGYPIGEVNTTYSRSAIGQLDSLHYLLMTVNYNDGYTVAANLNQLAQFIHSKGVQKAYNLDGGQTSLIALNGEPVNHVDYGYERTVSDIIYFATAVPEEEAAR